MWIAGAGRGLGARLIADGRDDSGMGVAIAGRGRIRNDGLLLLWVGFAGVGLSVFGELGVCSEIDVVVRVEDSGGSLELEAGHHQLHQMGRKRSGQCDAEVLLDQSGPRQTDVAMTVVRFSVYGSALLDGLSYDVAHLFGVVLG